MVNLTIPPNTGRDVFQISEKSYSSKPISAGSSNSYLRHQVETFSASQALCEGNPLVTGRFPLQRAATRNFDVFFDLRLKKGCWWFETPSRSLWRQCNNIYRMYIALFSKMDSFKQCNSITHKYSISQEICTRFLLCCALLWLYVDWFSHILQAYFTGTVAI